MDQTKLFEKIQEHLKNGGIVMISTYTKAWQYDKAVQAELFTLGNDKLIYIKRGKTKDCIAYSSIKFYKYA